MIIPTMTDPSGFFAKIPEVNREAAAEQARSTAGQAGALMSGFVVERKKINKQDVLGGRKRPTGRDPVDLEETPSSVEILVGPYYGDPRNDERLVATVTQLGAERGLIRTGLKVRIRKSLKSGKLGRGRIRLVAFTGHARLLEWAQKVDQVRRHMFYLAGPHFIVPLIVKPALDQVLPQAQTELQNRILDKLRGLTIANSS